MKSGKLDTNILESLIINPINEKILGYDDVLLKANVGEDCCVLNLGEEYAVLSMDPITATSESIGKIAININVNDIAASGALPIGIMTTILLPEGTDQSVLKNIIYELQEEAQKFGLKILGGHTEITDAINRPIISCCIIGKTINKKFVPTSGAKAGQSVIMTKFAGLEGTEIILNEMKLEDSIRREFEDETKDLGEFLSVIRESKIVSSDCATCMHDATEGGIFGACWEIAKASGCGINIFADKIPVLSSTMKICEKFHISPYRLISSGVLLITTFDAENLVKKIESLGIKATIIGVVTESVLDRFIYFENEKEILKEPESDEIYKINFKNTF